MKSATEKQLRDENVVKVVNTIGLGGKPVVWFF